MKAAVLGGAALFRGPKVEDLGLELVGQCVVPLGDAALLLDEVVKGLDAHRQGVPTSGRLRT